MNQKVLGIIAIICAPFLYLDFATSAPNTVTWKSGLYGFVYMAGWICSLLALKQMKILGKTKFAKVAFAVQFTFLGLAQAWNVWVMIDASADNVLFRVLDMCWPLSNIWMLVIGIAALTAGELQGWKRFVPLMVGLWFPLMVIPYVTMGAMVTLAGPYSAVAFALLGLVVYKAGDNDVHVLNNQVEIA